MDKLPSNYEYPPGTCDGMADYLDSLRRDEHEHIDNYSESSLDATDLYIGYANWGFVNKDEEKTPAPTPPKMRRTNVSADIDKILKYLDNVESDIDYIKKLVQRLRG